MFVVPTLSQEDPNFKVDHGYIKNLRPDWAAGDSAKREGAGREKEHCQGHEEQGRTENGV